MDLNSLLGITALLNGKRSSLREQKSTVAVSLDIEKAFDKAYHNGILFKMMQIGFDPQFCISASFVQYFMYDFPHELNDSQGILYADDSLLYAHDESPLVALSRVSSHLRNASGKCKYTVVPESKRLKLALGIAK
ncbi:hypothetical protein EVAR_68089_1 [Eumeta japonica]|uniref:Reverse transcriptase domain-containing protein n=1 Tax=Eumeta variegata TaxID=151549 RepID=A0A4C1TBD5_EUMVA|nr:hypothetical protein EVAR_68089_1 [Eumeta japonica]